MATKGIYLPDDDEVIFITSQNDQYFRCGTCPFFDSIEGQCEITHDDAYHGDICDCSHHPDYDRIEELHDEYADESEDDDDSFW